MTDDRERRQQLVRLIEARRDDIEAYLREARPRQNRLTNVGIVSGAVAALFVAGPAVGGPDFAQTVQEALNLTRSSLVWQVACLVGMLLSLVAVISTNLGKVQDLSARIALAEACRADLDGLRTFLEFGDLPMREAAELYKQALTKVSFVPGGSATPQLNRKQG